MYTKSQLNLIFQPGNSCDIYSDGSLSGPGHLDICCLNIAKKNSVQSWQFWTKILKKNMQIVQDHFMLNKNKARRLFHLSSGICNAMPYNAIQATQYNKNDTKLRTTIKLGGFSIGERHHLRYLAIVQVSFH